MKLRAKDTFHASGVGKVHAGQEFETHDALGQELADKGHAEILEASTDTAAGADQSTPAVPKSDLPPLAKVEPAPKNKRRKAETPEPADTDDDE